MGWEHDFSKDLGWSGGSKKKKPSKAPLDIAMERGEQVASAMGRAIKKGRRHWPEAKKGMREAARGARIASRKARRAGSEISDIAERGIQKGAEKVRSARRRRSKGYRLAKAERERRGIETHPTTQTIIKGFDIESAVGRRVRRVRNKLKRLRR